MNIEWPDLIGFFVVIAVVVLGVYLLGRLNRRIARRQIDAIERRLEENQETFKELQQWLLDKQVHDLAESDSATEDYIKAFIVITNQSRTISELRPIAEVYRFRKGFKNEWIGDYIEHQEGSI